MPSNVGRVAAIIQARMGSTRLPGKTLETLGDVTVLDWVVERVGMASLVDEVIVATSTNAEDDRIADYLAGTDTIVVRGSADDVLRRFADALDTTNADRVVRVTADCPFVQPDLIDLGVKTAHGHDYVATGLDGRFPRGFDLEVVTRESLLTAAGEATDPVEREHVTPFIVRRPDRFDCVPLVAPMWARHPSIRVTLDEPDDLTMLRAVVGQLGATPSTLTGEVLLAHLLANPHVVEINQHVDHRIVT